VEQFLERKLREYDPQFDMEQFLRDVQSHFSSSDEEEITGDVWDVLHSMGDFNEFKSMMLAHKQSLNGESIDMSAFMTIKHMI
jgi:ADP-ribosylation factor 2-binding protein